VIPQACRHFSSDRSNSASTGKAISFWFGARLFGMNL